MPQRYSEDDIIARVFAPIAGAAALGLKDDAALLAPESAPLVVTTDMVVAGVHFFADDDPSLIAKKALRVNLSDLAAKGAEPIGFLLGLGAARRLDQRLAGRFRRRARRGCARLWRAAHRRRHGRNSGPADHLDHGARSHAALRAPHRRKAWRRHLRLGPDRRRGAGSRAAPRPGARATTVG